MLDGPNFLNDILQGVRAGSDLVVAVVQGSTVIYDIHITIDCYSCNLETLYVPNPLLQNILNAQPFDVD